MGLQVKLYSRKGTVNVFPSVKTTEVTDFLALIDDNEDTVFRKS